MTLKEDPGNSKKAEQSVTSSRELQTSCRCIKWLRLGTEVACLLARAHPHHESGVGGVAGLFLVLFLKCFGWKPVRCHALGEISCRCQRNKCLESTAWIASCSLLGSKVLTVPAQETHGAPVYWVALASTLSSAFFQPLPLSRLHGCRP